MNTLLPNHQSWAAQELSTADFGDARLSKSIVRIVADSIRAAHLDATRNRIQHHETVLVLPDTTELLYTSHPHTIGLGDLDHAGSKGLKVHSALAATLDGVPLGLVQQAVWARAAAPKAKGRKSRKRPQAER